LNAGGASDGSFSWGQQAVVDLKEEESVTYIDELIVNRV